MNIEELRDYCLSLPGTTEDFPFDEVTLVFKIGGKMYLLTGLDGPFYINVKCDPDLAISLRELYPAVQPGFHMNKKHWNTVEVDGSVSDKLLKQWIDQSYHLVRQSLSKAVKLKLETDGF